MAGKAADGTLEFREARFPFGRALAARGPDGSTYVYGRPAPGAPPCAWRQTRSGDRQWLGFDLPSQSAGTQALRRMAALAAPGAGVRAMDWPIWDSKGLARDRHTPVKITRDANGVTFAPVAHGAEPLRIAGTALADVLAGRSEVAIPGADVDSSRTTMRLIVAMRDAPGLLSPGERLRSGAGLVLLGSNLHERSPARRALQRGLDRFAEAIAPMLDMHRPNRRILSIAAEALDTLRGGHPGLLGPHGRAWLGGEAAPALAVLEGRLRAHESERVLLDEFEVRGPAFA